MGDEEYEENMGGETPPCNGELVMDLGVGGVVGLIDVGENIEELNIKAGGDAEPIRNHSLLNHLFVLFTIRRRGGDSVRWT